MKINKNKFIEWLNMSLGVFIASFAFSFFISPKGFVIGGVSGISVILYELFGFDTALTILIMNILLLLLGFLCLGKEFFLKTIYGSLMFPVFVKLFDLLYSTINPETVNDNLLLIVFSSLIMGYGLGLAVKNGGTTGGVDIPQNILLKFFHIPFSVSIIIIDGTIILLGYLLIPNSDLSLILYGILFAVVSGIVVDKVIFSGFNKRAVYIISDKNDEIKNKILEQIGRGVTKMKIVGGYTNKEKEKLVCVLSNFEYFKLKKIIEECDPTAFFYAVRASEVSGEGFTYEK